ncbi:hypothetical protein H9X99_15070 [Intestinimonas butyriciproducens]|nr:hypothetical protein [Intestinimonas butyriciproducens]
MRHESKWICCPQCGSKTKVKVYEETVLQGRMRGIQPAIIIPNPALLNTVLEFHGVHIQATLFTEFLHHGVQCLCVGVVQLLLLQFLRVIPPRLKGAYQPADQAAILYDPAVFPAVFLCHIAV